MSNAVFPVLPGLAWPMVKAPEFSTAIKRAVSGREYRAAFMQYPLWTFTLPYDLLRDSATLPELQTLLGFFLARQGSFDNFLYADPDDDLVTAQNFGTGNGVLVLFPLVRAFGAGGFTANDLVQNVNAITGIYDNGNPVVQGAGAGKYTIDGLGNITFGTAPLNTHALTWTGTYYYRCRFVTDVQDFSKFMINAIGGNLWDISGSKGLQFVGSTQNKV